MVIKEQKQRKKYKLPQKNKRGWIRIIEVFFALMIILSAIIILIAIKGNPISSGNSIYERQRQILNLISKNDALRTEIITTGNTANNPNINGFITKLASSGWEFSTNICKINDACPNPSSILNSQVYSTEIIITTTLTNYNPKKLRLFIWTKR